MSGPSNSSLALISTRRRACKACQQAKRRCDQQLPRCGRCTQKGLEDCNYPSLEAAVAAADFNFFTDVLSGAAATPDFLRNIMSVPVGTEAESSWSMFYNNSGATPSRPPSILPTPSSIFISQDAVLYCTAQLRDFPRRWVSQNGVAPFIHPALYLSTTSGADGLPSVLQDCFCACAAFAAKNEDNAVLVSGVVEAKATSLIHIPEQATWTLPQQVAALQALVMYQVMRWFDGDIRQRVLADSMEPILAAWASSLQSRVGASVFSGEEGMLSIALPESHVPPQQQVPPSSSSSSAYQLERPSPHPSHSNTPGRPRKEELETSWRRWLMAESVRRVLVMACLIRAVYATAKQGDVHGKLSGGSGPGTGHQGSSDCSLGLAGMGFTAQARLWAATTAERWDRSRVGDAPWWVERMEFSSLLALADPRDMDEFTILLAVVFRGKDTIEDWMNHGPGAM